MSDTTNESRAMDAKLHVLLGHRAWFFAEQPSMTTYGDGPLGVTSNFSGAVFTASREWLVDDWLGPATNDEVPHYSHDYNAIERARTSAALGRGRGGAGATKTAGSSPAVFAYSLAASLAMISIASSNVCARPMVEILFTTQ